MALHLLLVEDDDDYRALLVDFFTSEGHSVLECASAQEAIGHMQGGNGEAPSLVLTDMQMDRMTGLELARALRQTHPGLPIILMTAFGQRQLAREALALGRSAYIEKPFRLIDLMAEIERMVAAAEG
jgi:CheY-like chemotaxis protein